MSIHKAIMSTELSLFFAILILNAVILAAHPLEPQKVYLLPEHVLLIISADSPAWGKLGSPAPAILVVKPNEFMPGDVLQCNITLVRNNVKAWYCNTRSSILARSSGRPDLWVQIIDKDSQQERRDVVQRRPHNHFLKGDDVFYARLNLIHLRGLEAGVGKRMCSRLQLPYRRLVSARDDLESKLVFYCRHWSDLIDSTTTITSAPGPAHVAHVHMLSLITAFLASHPHFFLNLAIFFLLVAFMAAAVYFTIE